MNPWEILLRRLLRAPKWPLPSELPVRRMIALWAALRENDEPVLRRVMQWKVDRDLVIDNLPEKMATAYGDLLFGSAPEWTPADVADEERLTDMTAGWDDDLGPAEETCVSEGEVWWRLSTNRELAHPVLTWHTRHDVVPLLWGRAVQACAFVSRLEALNPADKQTVWRHLEIHGRGIVVNVLMEGRHDALGTQRTLDRHPETVELAEVWQHGLPGMLAGRIVNRYGRKPHCGVSIYKGVWTRFLGINEAVTVGKENMRLTAKKRAVIPASALRARQQLPTGTVPTIDRGDGSLVPIRGAEFDAGEDVLVHDPLDVDESRGSDGPFKVLEYSFDAEALIAWLRFEIETTCQRCDIVPQFIGSGDFGSATSGTALRVRLLPTTNAAEGRAKQWDGALPGITTMAALLEQLPQAEGGLGNSAWTNPAGTPSVERGSALPMDETEVAQRQSTLKTAGLISVEHSVRERYPDWSDDQVAAEVDAIRSDEAASLPAPTFGTGPTPAPPPGPGQQ